MQKTISLKIGFNPVDTLGKPTEVLAGFFVSKTPVENKAEFLKTAWAQAGFESKTPLYLKQVHSSTVIKFLDGDKLTQIPTGDAIITDSKNGFIVIQVADCLPVLFFDPVKKLIAGAHAGWKGSLLGVAPEAVRQLIQLGSQAENLRVWLGPSIRACCYEVDMERSVLFSLGSARDKPRRAEAGRHIDLVYFNQELLEKAGIRKENIFVDPRCTACSTEEFPSYRREGKGAGRIFACLALK